MLLLVVVALFVVGVVVVAFGCDFDVIIVVVVAVAFWFVYCSAVVAEPALLVFFIGARCVCHPKVTKSLHAKRKQLTDDAWNCNNAKHQI
jgi:hypothetical protein